VINNHAFERIGGKQHITITTLSVDTGRFNKFLPITIRNELFVMVTLLNLNVTSLA